MHGLLITAYPYLAQYGYWALFIALFAESLGLPLPGETFLVASAFLAIHSQMHIVWVVIIAVLAAVLGDNTGYMIGRWGGRRLIVRYGGCVGITTKHLTKTERFFLRFGAEAVIVARFIPVLRQLNGLVAGVAQMPWQRFVIYNMLGALLWVGTWTVAVFLLGHQVELWLVQVHDLATWLVISVGILAVFGGGILFFSQMHKR
jgi:membrane protein DedA with SNARE-associated domain